jgi:hypothetical protein
MSHRIVALLDRPSPRSFGMVPFVERIADGTLRVHGLHGRPAQGMLDADLGQLLQEHSALALDVITTEPITETTVAGWVGVQFRQEARRIPPQVPWGKCRPTTGQEGHFWLGFREAIHRTMEQWVKEAARDVFERGDANLAKQMIWVMPDSELTRAALWSTKTTEKERQERIAWWLRLERDAGRAASEAEVTERFTQLREEYVSANRNRLARFPKRSRLHRSTRAAPLFQDGFPPC